MDSLRKLQQLFKKFPGIGERQAMRFAYFLTTSDDKYVEELIDTVKLVKQAVKKCKRCYALSEKIVSGLCHVCNEPTKDSTLLLVVEKDADRERFLQSKSYKGTYFVLGGLSPAIEKDARSHIRINELISLIESESKSGLSEIILALSATPDGLRTELMIKIEIEKIIAGKNMKVSFLGRGLSTGTEIEYSDADTLRSALRSRTSDI